MIPKVSTDMTGDSWRMKYPILPADGIAEPWNGEFYVSFGHSATRSWAEAVQYGFICGGGGAWYSRTLQILKPDDSV